MRRKHTLFIIPTIILTLIIMSGPTIGQSVFAKSDDEGNSGSSDQQGSSNDQQQGSDDNHFPNGLCPQGHKCICTPASGVFHDLTTGFNINTGCTSNKG